MQKNSELQFAVETMQMEADAIARAAGRLGEGFEKALGILAACSGKIVVSGVGKSGIAARKLAATLASTGSPAFFLHPVEALHGDLGAVTGDDVAIALSQSGESAELNALLPALRARKTPIVALTGNAESVLARLADITLDTSVEREACPLNLAPTASVLVALAVGDALAMCLQKRRGLSAEEYALNHPGGRLGRRLTLCVRDVMPVHGENVPSVAPAATFETVVCSLSAGHMGAVCVCGETREMLGIITEGDVHKALLNGMKNGFDFTAADIMNAHPQVTLAPGQLAYEALQIMTQRLRPVSVAPVLQHGLCVGMLRVNDLVQAGL